ncbi:MAG: helix-turn-helix domain-containing protein [Phormidesmis sp.]
MADLTDYTHPLNVLMKRVDILSYRALAELADVSRWQIQQLRAGQATIMRVSNLVKLSGALQISLSELLSQFGVDAGETQLPEQTEPKQRDHTKVEPEPTEPEQAQANSIEALRREYLRLQQQQSQQLAAARSQFQSESLRTLETWLVQWPTIAKRAKERGAELPAEKILPFIRPVEALVAQWGVEAISPIDSQVPYDPQYHQLMGATAEPGDPVMVTHSGATHSGQLLHRAKVKVITS